MVDLKCLLLTLIAAGIALKACGVRQCKVYRGCYCGRLNFKYNSSCHGIKKF